MTVRQFDVATCTCVVSASHSVHDAMLPYIEPFLASRLDQPDVVVVIGCDAATVDQTRRALAGRAPTARRMSHPQQHYHVWTGVNQEVLLPEHAPDHVITSTGDHLFLTAACPQVAATVGIRIIRQLIMRGGEAAGGRCVHAGAVAITTGGDEEGVLVGGHPGAGKTSVLTHLVERHGAKPVANDRTVLVPAHDRSWQAVGVPLAWRFTAEGIAGSPALSTAFAHRAPRRGRDLVDGKVELTPAEISHALGRSTLPATRVARIIVLQRSADPTPITLDGSFLRGHLAFGADDFFAEDWLGVRPHLERNPEQPSTDAAGWWNEVASAVPVHLLSWTDPTELPAIAAAAARGTRS